MGAADAGVVKSAGDEESAIEDCKLDIKEKYNVNKIAGQIAKSDK